MDITKNKERYDPVNQPGTYAIFCGLVPELREMDLPKSSECGFKPNEDNFKNLTRIVLGMKEIVNMRLARWQDYEDGINPLPPCPAYTEADIIADGIYRLKKSMTSDSNKKPDQGLNLRVSDSELDLFLGTNPMNKILIDYFG